MNMMRPRLLFVVSEDWYFCSHRLPLARAAVAAGFEVAVATRVIRDESKITSEGISVHNINFRRNGRNLFREIVSIAELVRLYRGLRPDIVHHVALKPVFYGAIANQFVKLPNIVNALTGLGHIFTSERYSARILKYLVQTALGSLLRNSKVILQNQDDLKLLIERGVVEEHNTVLIRGSGVNTDQFQLSPESEGPPCVLFPARMLYDKGLIDFIEAAKLLRNNGVNARFILAGDVDLSNPSSVTNAQLRVWKESGIVEWTGRREDMASLYRSVHIVCLPSHREGLPKALLEAAASGRAIVTTDVPGCREVVKHEINGLVVPRGDVGAISQAIDRLINDSSLRNRLGSAGREIVVSRFSAEIVNTQTMSLYKCLLERANNSGSDIS